MLIPMYFLIGVWGAGRRKYAAMKFVLYTIVGSVFILVAIIGLYYTDVRDFVDVATVDDRAAERLKENPHLTRTRPASTTRSASRSSSGPGRRPCSS